MVSACSICQGGLFNPWSTWITNCSQIDISIGKYAITLPQGLAVPTWAYLNPTITGTFDENQAIQIANDASHAPDSTAAPTPTTTSGSGSFSGNSSSNAGTIAGGVVGGIAGLAILAFLIFFILCRRRNTKPHDQYAQEKLDLGSPPTTSVNTDAYSQPHTINSSSIPMKLYDPNDPSTFPKTPVCTYPTSTPPPGSATSYGVHGSETHNLILVDSTYRGIPEI
ncbi:hypothetical protein M422DRAFT_276249 [Sphaerobolus stellatus SS14]|uniref:Uncharacterized protein n=1 Tax=Sphaerobolus stellatus (strain SS14) TaxID=990650 RepID=A0A0C9UCL9_SPHS4|nr:hypothetical protein M422DRAFT_276249 [Sphaerobolus stellatus SS14]